MDDKMLWVNTAIQLSATQMLDHFFMPRGTEERKTKSKKNLWVEIKITQ